MSLQLLADQPRDAEVAGAVQPRLGNESPQLFVIEDGGVWFLKCPRHGAIAKAFTVDRIGPRRCRWCEL